MNDYLGGLTLAELESLLRRLIAQGGEGPKVDFKKELAFSDKAAQADLAKDISSIANTDDEVHLRNFGYIIVGAVKGSLIGGVGALAGDMDNLQAQLTDIVRGYVAPVPPFSICAFNDAQLGRWGALVIPPSATQPHVLIRDGAGDVVKHEWWVRVNDLNARAGAIDYARILEKATRRAVRPLELEMQRLALRVSQLGAPGVDTLVDAIRSASSGQTEPSRRWSKKARARRATSRAAAVAIETEQATPTLLLSVRRELVRGSAGVEEGLVAEALRVAETMDEDSEDNPLDLAGVKPEQLRHLLSHMEDRTFPLAEAFATIARHDREGLLAGAVCRALRVIAREPEPRGRHYPHISQLRLYPLALCLYAIALIATNERRGDLLKHVFRLTLRRARGQGVAPIVDSLSSIRVASKVFSVAAGKNGPEPVAVRVREAWVPRFSGLFAGTASNDAFAVAEFVMALAFLSVSQGLGVGKMPLGGIYLYESSAQGTLGEFLQERPDWIGDALGEQLDSLLPAFDASAARVRWPDANGFGFVGGAMRAYERKAGA